MDVSTVIPELLKVKITETNAEEIIHLSSSYSYGCSHLSLQTYFCGLLGLDIFSPREAVDAPSLGTFKANVDGALGSPMWWVATLSVARGVGTECWNKGVMVTSNLSLSMML